MIAPPFLGFVFERLVVSNRIFAFVIEVFQRSRPMLRSSPPPYQLSFALTTKSFAPFPWLAFVRLSYLVLFAPEC